MRDDGDIQQTESLAMNHLSVEEVAARRNELRKMRELMFRAEAKAKRVSKIKSKTYRRIKKKEKEKMAKKLDGNQEEEDEEESRMKREVERARERATLRHKNTGKWAKAMKAKGELDVDERREISEMLERSEQLRRKISGVKGSDDEDDDESGESEGGGEGGLEKIRAGAFDELAKINRADNSTANTENRSIFEMKFMKDAMARNERQIDQMMDDFVKEMGGNDGASGEDDGEDDVEAGGASVSRTGGRAVYRPAPTVRLNISALTHFC